MKPWVRLIAGSAVAGMLALVLALVPTNLSPAAASTLVPVIPPGTPTPVNVLPSTVTSSFGPNVPGSYQQSLQFLYKMQQSPEFWEAVRRQQMGTATSTDLVRIQQVSDTHRVPATKTQTLQKVGAAAGGVLGAVSTFSLGTMIGATGLDLFGFDREGTVCGGTSGAGQVFVSLLTATDCSGVNQFADDFVANYGVVPGWSGGPQQCDPRGCATLSSRVAYTVGTNALVGYCFAITGSGMAASNPAYVQVRHAVDVGSSTRGAGLEHATSGVAAISRCGGGPASTSRIYVSAASLGELVSWAVNGTSPQAPVETTSVDPLRTLKCTVASTTGQVFTGVSGTYSEGAGVLPSPNCPDLPPGMDLDSVKIDEVLGNTSTRLWEQQTTDEYQHVQQLAPECAQGTCMLDLRTATGSCFQTPAECLDWFADPNKETKFSCHYGAHPVSLAECALYAPTFKPESKASGDTLGDPQSGTSTPAPNGARPGQDEATFGTGVQNPNAERKCWGAGWGSPNPLDWVMKPIQCGLQWAFVPRTSAIANFGGGLQSAMQASLAGSMMQWGATFDEVFRSNVTGGCEGPPFRVQMPFFAGDGMDKTYYPLSSCFQPMASIASMFNVLSTGIVFIGAGLAVVRYFAGIFGFIGFGSKSNAEPETSKVVFK